MGPIKGAAIREWWCRLCAALDLHNVSGEEGGAIWGDGDKDDESAGLFLFRWGRSALFHDTGNGTISDFMAHLNEFRNAYDAPIKARTLLAGTDFFVNISSTVLGAGFEFSHIAVFVKAFRGWPYPYSIQTCP